MNLRDMLYIAAYLYRYTPIYVYIFLFMSIDMHIFTYIRQTSCLIDSVNRINTNEIDQHISWTWLHPTLMDLCWQALGVMGVR